MSVLWVLVLLSLIAASFNFTTRTDVNLARNLVEGAKAEALADAGVYRAIAGLLRSVDQGGWRVDDAVYAWRYGGGEIRVAVQDEGGKIDINTAQDALLGVLFESLGLDAQASAALVDAIADFRDPDSLRRLNGAEDNDYAAAGLAHDAKDGRFDTVEELQQVLGMDPEFYDRVAPMLTVYTRRRTPHLATAPAALRQIVSEVGDSKAFGMRRALRQAQEDVQDEVSEPPAPQTEASTSELSEVPVIIQGGRSTARSNVNVYTVHAEGRTEGGSVFVREAVVRVTGGSTPFRFHAWRRGRRALFPPEVEPAER